MPGDRTPGSADRADELRAYCAQRVGITASLAPTASTAFAITAVYVAAFEHPAMSKISVEIPDELLADLDRHVGDGKKFVNRSEAVRASIRKTLDQLDEIDARRGRLDDEE